MHYTKMKPSWPTGWSPLWAYQMYSEMFIPELTTF